MKFSRLVLLDARSYSHTRFNSFTSTFLAVQGNVWLRQTSTHTPLSLNFRPAQENPAPDWTQKVQFQLQLSKFATRHSWQRDSNRLFRTVTLSLSLLRSQLCMQFWQGFSRRWISILHRGYPFSLSQFPLGYLVWSDRVTIPDDDSIYRLGYDGVVDRFHLASLLKSCLEAH